MADETSNGTITLSSGVELRIKQVNPMILDHMLRHNMPSAPKVPKSFIEAKGREEDNPDHPDYRQAVDEYNALRGEMVNSVMMGLGTEVATLPKGFDGPNGQAWAEELGAVGMEIPEEKFKRYRFWVEFWACKTTADHVNILQAVTNGIATPEVAVAEAAESFRNREGRRADRKLRDKTSR